MIDFYADTPDEKEPKEKDFYPEESKDIDFYPDNIPDATPDITQEKPKEPSLFETLTKSLRISEEQRVGGTLKVPEGLGESFRKAEEQRVGSGILEALDSEEFKTHITELFAHEGRRIEQEVDLGTKSGFSTTKHFLNNVTFNATKELLKDMPDESKAGALLGEFAGEAVYWLAISKLIGPFAAEVKATYGSLTTSSFYLNSILPAGAFKFTLSELIDKGEMPTGRELAEYENDLVLIHAAFELAGLGIQFNTAMRANAKLAGHSVADEYIDLAKSLKEAFVPNKFKNMSNKGQIEVLKDLITKRSTEIGFERPDIEIEGKRPIDKPEKPIAKPESITKPAKPKPGGPIEPKDVTQKARDLEINKKVDLLTEQKDKTSVTTIENPTAEQEKRVGDFKFRILNDDYEFRTLEEIEHFKDSLETEEYKKAVKDVLSLKSPPKDEVKFGHGRPSTFKKEDVGKPDAKKDIVLDQRTGSPIKKSRPIQIIAFKGDKKGLLGDADYFSIDDNVAKKGGKEVIKDTVFLKNPYILDSNKQLVQLGKEVGRKFPKTDQEIKDFYDDLRENLLGKGHDGVIVHFPESGDFNKQKQRVDKLRDHFGDSQVVKFPEKEVGKKILGKVEKSDKTKITKEHERIAKQAVAKEVQKKAAKAKAAEPPKKPPKKPPTKAAVEPPAEPPKKKKPSKKTTPKPPTEVTPKEERALLGKAPLFGKLLDKASGLIRVLDKLPRALKPQSSLAKKLWDLRLDYFGDKRGAAMRHRAKWTKVLSERKLNSKDREDIIFYMEDPQAVGKSRDLEGTGNPFKDIDDTWNAIDKRMSPAAKEAVKDIRKHFQEVLKVLNESPYIKNISPREFLHEIYMPHFYEGNLDKALDAILADKRFSTSNPFADMRKFTLLNDALRKAGLIPKYRDIGTLLNHYDALVTRLILNSNLAQEIKLLEKEIGEKLVARPNDAKLYNRARNEKWEEFSDPYMRRRVIRQEEDGTLVFGTSDANALVHPDLAPAIAGIFVKEAYKPDNIFLRGMDYYNDQVRGLRVQFYPMFHMGALSESLLGAQGLEGVFKLFKDFNVIFSDPEFNEFAAASGLEFGIPSDAKIGDAKVIFESALNKLEIRGGKAGITAGTIRKGLKKGMIGTEILFGQIHPRMKMLTFADYLAKVERQALKDGVDMTPEWRKQTGREIASIVNDQFGGQAWEMIRTFSNPKFLKWSRRGISYVDWSLSSIRQYFAMFEDIPRILRGEGPSIRGKFARQYNARYITYMTIISQFMSLLYTGMGNDKDKNGKPIANSVTWDYRKAHTTFQNKDSKHSGYLTQFFHYQLPDIQYNINGVKFNPGRDEKGRRLYSHGGKQFLELDNYRSNFVGQMFNKSTPFIQLAIPWAMDKKPGKGDWKTRGVWQGGKTIPWDGSEDWSLDRAISFIRFTRDQFIPFFADAAYKNPASFPVVFFGTFPVSKGISLTGSEEYFRTYYRILENDGYSEAAKKTARKRINELEDVLYDQNYSQTQINRRKNAAIKWNKERSSR